MNYYFTGVLSEFYLFLLILAAQNFSIHHVVYVALEMNLLA